jgi:hypothetical protein
MAKSHFAWPASAEARTVGRFLRGRGHCCVCVGARIHADLAFARFPSSRPPDGSPVRLDTRQWIRRARGDASIRCHRGDVQGGGLLAGRCPRRAGPVGRALRRERFHGRGRGRRFVDVQASPGWRRRGGCSRCLDTHLCLRPGRGALLRCGGLVPRVGDRLSLRRGRGPRRLVTLRSGRRFGGRTARGLFGSRGRRRWVALRRVGYVGRRVGLRLSGHRARFHIGRV